MKSRTGGQDRVLKASEPKLMLASSRVGLLARFWGICFIVGIWDCHSSENARKIRRSALAEPRRMMCGVPVRHPELAAAPDLKPKRRIHVFRPFASPAGSKLLFLRSSQLAFASFNQEPDVRKFCLHSGYEAAALCSCRVDRKLRTGLR